MRRPLSSTRLKPNFLRFHKALCQLEVDTAPIYRQLGIREKDFQNEASAVDMATYLESLNLAAKQIHQPCIGISIALLGNTHDLGVTGYMIRNAHNLEKCLELSSDYVELVAPGARLSLVKNEETCTYIYEIQGFTPEQCRQDVEMTITQMINLMREVLPFDDYRPGKIFFQHQAPAIEMPLYNTLAQEVIFNHHFNGVIFPAEFLFYSVSDADPQLLRTLENQIQKSIEQFKIRGDLLNRITLLISSGLGKTDVSADKIASHLGMSRRTLHRRLSEHGTCYSDLRDIVISQVAKEILSTTSVSITELAQQLGYSDSSAFDRAFKRLTGVTPLEYSRHHSPK